MMKTKCLSPLKHALVILLGAVLLLGLWPGFVLADDTDQTPQVVVEELKIEDEDTKTEEEKNEVEEVAKNTYLFYIVVDDVKEESPFFEQSYKNGELIQLERPTIQDHLFQGAFFASTGEAFDFNQPVQVSADSNGQSIEVLLIYTADSATPPPPPMIR